MFALLLTVLHLGAVVAQPSAAKGNVEAQVLRNRDIEGQNNLLVRRGNAIAVPVTNHFVDAGYTVNITIGAPLQTVPVTLDSMNSDLAVYYRKQTHPSSDFLSTGTGFNANDSTTWKKEGNLSSPVVIVGSDMVTLGGDSTFQSFIWVESDESSRESTWGFSPKPNDYRTGTNKTSFWWQQYQQWPEPKVGLHLKRYRADPDPKAKPLAPAQVDGGELMIGGQNTTFFDSANGETFNQPQNASYWVAPLHSITVGGKLIDVTASDNSKAGEVQTADGTKYVNAAVSTSGNYIVGTADVIADIIANIPAATSTKGQTALEGTFMIPCNTSDFSITLGIGANNYTLHQNDLIRGITVDQMGTRNRLNVTNFDNPTGNCLLAIRTYPPELRKPDSDIPSWELGVPFLRTVYTTFTFAPPSVAFNALTDAAWKTNPVYNDTTTTGSKSGAVPAASLSSFVVVATVLVAVCLL